MVEIPQALRDSLAKRELMLVVGSGASIAATGSPHSPASWTGLLEHGVRYAQGQGLLDDEAAHAAATFLQQGQLSAVGIVIREALQDHRTDWLRDAFGSLKLADGPPALHQAIGGLGADVIVTTNYDDLLEKSLGRAPVPWTAREFAAALGDSPHAHRQVLHIHGYYREDDSVILDPADYTRLTGHPAMNRFAAAATQRSLLFVGCGPDGLRDQHFRQLWFWLEELGDSAPHFALIPASVSTTEIRAAGYSRLSFLRFDDSAEDPYADLVATLERLATEAGAKTTQLRDLGRTAVDAPPLESVKHTVIAIRAEAVAATSREAALELRRNLLDRLQRLLSRETRGAGLCVLCTPMQDDDLQAICRISDVPVLALMGDGTFTLMDGDGTARAAHIVAPACVRFDEEGMPQLDRAQGGEAEAGFVLATAMPTTGHDAPALVVTSNLVALSGQGRELPVGATRLRGRPSHWELRPATAGDVVLTFEVEAGAGAADVLAGAGLSEVVYGLEQTRFARLSRVLEGKVPLTGEAIAELRSTLEGLTAEAFPLLRSDLDEAERHPDREVRLRHLAAASHLRSAPEALYESLVDDTSAQQRRLELLPWVRRSLRAAVDASAALATEGKTPRRLIIAASLGEMDPERAANAFPLQRTLLAYVAQQRLRLTYTLVSRQTTQDHASSKRHFLIHCFASADREPVSTAESQSVVAVVQSTFHNNYSIQYSTAVPQDLHDASVAAGDAEGYSRAWIVPTRPDGDWPVSDYGLVSDYIRTLPADVAVTWECSGDVAQIGDGAAHPAQGADTVPGRTLGSSAFDDLRRLATDPPFTAPTVALRCLVSVRGTDDDAAALAREVGKLVGTEVFGAKQFDIEPDDRGGYTAVSVGQALLAMHTPFGQMYATSYDTNRRFVVPLKDQVFDEGVVLGTATRKRVDRDQNELVRLSDIERFHHVHVVGRPGAGKTTLLKRMILGDLSAGNGVTVVDPHGSLADWTIENLPPDRIDDTIFIDLDNRTFAPVLNLLDVGAAHGDDYERVVSEITHFIRSRNYHEWTGPAFEQLVRLALLSMRDPAYPAPPAITELPLLLGNDRMRAAMGRRAHSEDLRDSWRLQSQQGNQRAAELLQWVIAKFDELTKDAVLRAFLGGDHATLDVRSAIAEGKVLIFRLASTTVSEQASDFIGSMFLTDLQRGLLDAATSRDRPPHFVYIDEFHRFATLGLERLVVEARKFKVGMTLAHQNLSQLAAFQQHTGRFLEGVPSTLVGNAGTLVVFPVSSYDRKQLAHELGCGEEDIGRLARFQALVRASATAGAIQPFTIEIDDMGEPDAGERREQLERSMRDRRIWLPIVEVLDTVAERHHALRKWSTDGTAPHQASPRDADDGAGRGSSPATPPPPVVDDRETLSPFLREWFSKRDAEASRLGSAALDETSPDDGGTEGTAPNGTDPVVTDGDDTAGAEAVSTGSGPAHMDGHPASDAGAGSNGGDPTSTDGHGTPRDGSDSNGRRLFKRKRRPPGGSAQSR